MHEDTAQDFDTLRASIPGLSYDSPLDTTFKSIGKSSSKLNHKRFFQNLKTVLTLFIGDAVCSVVEW